MKKYQLLILENVKLKIEKYSIIEFLSLQKSVPRDYLFGGLCNIILHRPRRIVLFSVGLYPTG
jgi:hypothetical protein